MEANTDEMGLDWGKQIHGDNVINEFYFVQTPSSQDDDSIVV
jgi:hypothetical protein